MKLLILQETDWLKRGPHQQHHLADRLSLRGHEIEVIDFEFTWRTDGKKELFSRRKVFNNVNKIDDRARITVIRPGIIKISPLDYVSLIFTHKKEIERQIKGFSPDVIIGYGILNAYLASKAARRHNIPFVYYWIDVLHRLIPNKLFQPIGKMLEKKSIKDANRVLVINDTLGDFVANLGASRELTRVVRAGIDISKFDFAISSDPVKYQYGIGREDKVIFFMGWLYNFSGLKEVALKLAESDNKHLKLLIVGDGDAYTELQRIQVYYKLQDRIILTGKKSYHEMPGFVAASDICLLPSYPWEPVMQDIVPIKLYEYMAMKKPVICTRLPGLMREFGDDNGIIYVDKPEDVIEKANELISKNYLEDLGNRARKFVERHSWENITDEFEKILQEVVKE